MSRINSGLGTTGASSASQTTGNDLSKVILDQFLDLLLAELQNQDPLNPLDNAELLQQISQIRQIGATNELSNTLSAVSDGQNLTAASTLIGKRVKALDDSGQEVQGVVGSASVQTDSETKTRQYKVHIGGSTISLNNIREIDS